MNETKKINIWETKFEDKTIYFNDIDEFINYLDTINNCDYTIYEKYLPIEEPQLILDKQAKKQNISITYTDNTHNITVIDFGGFIGKEIIIHPSFYEKHKNKIIEFTKKKVFENIENKKALLYIPNNILTDELIDILVSTEDIQKSSIYISKIIDLNLTEEQITKIKNAHLELTYGRERISKSQLIDYYTIIDLKKLDNLRINSNHNLNEIENFKYLNDNCNIEIVATDKNNELQYLNELQKIFNILKNHNKKYNIKISINNRELLKKSNILNTPNINFTINNDLYNYNQEEYLKEEEILDKLVEPIKKANLSPYEKYIAVYNIVKQFKPYKENHEDKDQSRYLRYILNNDYIVCVGYAKLLKTLLDKVDIPCITISAGIDISYDSSFTMEEKETEIEGHERNIVKIDDNKYNIHGIYIADATWDNDIDFDLYNNLSLTFDKKKEARRLESLSPEDLLLDFHNFEEFTKKLNYYLKKEINSNKKYYKDNNKCIINAYYQAYSKIMTMLSTLDYNKYQELYDKYDKLIKDNENNLINLENIYSDFLTDYAEYIIPLSNKNIDNNILFTATINTKKELNNYSKEKLESMKEKLTANHTVFEEYSFPYQYNPNAEEHYLETKNRR